ncbi:hypothetical protein Tco_1391357 [Tanacetum coccineum]
MTITLRYMKYGGVTELVDFDVDDEVRETLGKKIRKKTRKKNRNKIMGMGNIICSQNPNPQPGNMNGWLEEDDDVNENVNNEDIEDEDVETEVDDDAELIFPYEVESPKDEEVDVAPREVDVAH